MDASHIEAEALALPLEARAALVHRLLLSLEDVSEPEFDRIWGEESARRTAEFDAGHVGAISGSEVAKKARALLR